MNSSPSSAEHPSTCAALHPTVCPLTPRRRRGCPCECGDFLLFFCRKAALYQPQQVATVQLSTFLKQRNVRTIDHLKIDAQASRPKPRSAKLSTQPPAARGATAPLARVYQRPPTRSLHQRLPSARLLPTTSF